MNGLCTLAGEGSVQYHVKLQKGGWVYKLCDSDLRDWCFLLKADIVQKTKKQKALWECLLEMYRICVDYL